MRSESASAKRYRSITRKRRPAYYLIIDGQEYWARDFDSVHGYHGHAIGHERVEADRITFKAAAEAAWEIVSQEEELTGE